MNDKVLLGKKIKEIRKARGLTQEKLAELVGMEFNTISIIETGKNFPALPSLVKIASALGVSLCDFFTYDYPASSEEMKKSLFEKIEKMDEKELLQLFKYVKNTFY